MNEPKRIETTEHKAQERPILDPKQRSMSFVVHAMNEIFAVLTEYDIALYNLFHTTAESAKKSLETAHKDREKMTKLTTVLFEAKNIGESIAMTGTIMAVPTGALAGGAVGAKLSNGAPVTEHLIQGMSHFGMAASGTVSGYMEAAVSDVERHVRIREAGVDQDMQAGRITLVSKEAAELRRQTSDNIEINQQSGMLRR